MKEIRNEGEGSSVVRWGEKRTTRIKGRREIITIIVFIDNTLRVVVFGFSLSFKG